MQSGRNANSNLLRCNGSSSWSWFWITSRSRAPAAQMEVGMAWGLFMAQWLLDPDPA
jgi:hypothetical protein